MINRTATVVSSSSQYIQEDILGLIANWDDVLYSEVFLYSEVLKYLFVIHINIFLFLYYSHMYSMIVFFLL